MDQIVAENRIKKKAPLKAVEAFARTLCKTFRRVEPFARTCPPDRTCRTLEIACRIVPRLMPQEGRRHAERVLGAGDRGVAAVDDSGGAACGGRV
jgi:hypothetical protein